MTSSHAADSENIVIMELPTGKVKIELLPEIAPNHVKRIKELVNQGFYNGLKFHRVIPGFMAQTGDPSGDGTGGSGKNLKAEFNDTPHQRGTVSMARAMSPDSADSQFFIVFDDAPHLDGQYTAFGKVISGMEHVDSVKKGDSANNGMVDDPDSIISMKMASSK
ncbi:MAG: peptidylprolyl isomerase [Rickettsiales bacterium]